MDRYLAVMAGAALGGAARYTIAAAITARFGGRFPLGTFLVNVTGCFLIGLISTILAERSANLNWGLFLVTGILGGYTTFSAFGWETVQLSRQGSHMLALANVVGSAALGYLAVWLGILIARR
ncbi:MAG: fluoride efflux transporter CrcB [Acidobacteriota bacterium]